MRMDAQRTLAGRAARASGESLESALDAYHADLARRGIAWVRRVGTPVKVLGPVASDGRGRRVFKAAFDGEQGCDFVGFRCGGQHIAIEAKTHAGPDAWDCGVGLARDGVPFGGCGSSGLRRLQWEELWRVQGEEGVALIILRAWGGVWAIEPDSLAVHVKAAGRRTVRSEEIDNIGRRLVGVAWGG